MLTGNISDGLLNTSCCLGKWQNRFQFYCNVFLHMIGSELLIVT